MFMITDTVYHYCSLETFLSILKNRTIRLSDVHKLNDATETKVFLDILKGSSVETILEKQKGDYFDLIKGMDEKTAVNYVVNTMLDQILNYNDLLRYIACFSEDGDLLSQWLRYANNGMGVSIGFNADMLNQIATMHEDLYFRKVLYIDEKNIIERDLVTYYSRRIMDNLPIHIAYNEVEKILTSADRIPQYLRWYNELIDESIFYKHYSFREEQEWRLAFTDESLSKFSGDWRSLYFWDENPSKTDSGKDNPIVIEPDEYLKKTAMDLFPKGIEFRSRGDDVVSYLDLKLCQDDDLFEYICKIFIGPNCRIDEDDISQILQHFYCDHEICIEKSSSPYRII